MRRLGIAAVLVLAAALFLLTASQHDEKSTEARAAAANGPAQALLQADSDFDRAVAAKGIEAWVSCFAEGGAMMPAGGTLVRGHDAIRETMSPAFETSGFSLRWKPTGAEISSSEDLGYTFGTYESTAPGPDGERITRYGKYVTIWKKQSDGTWKIVMDIGNSSPAPGGKPE